MTLKVNRIFLLNFRLIPSFVCLLFLSGFSLTSCELDVLHQWNFLSYELPYDYPVNGGYVPENNVFTGMEVGWSRIFLAIPRLRVGVPATLVSIPRTRGGELSSPVLKVSTISCLFVCLVLCACNLEVGKESEWKSFRQAKIGIFRYVVLAAYTQRVICESISDSDIDVVILFGVGRGNGVSLLSFTLVLVMFCTFVGLP